MVNGRKMPNKKSIFNSQYLHLHKKTIYGRTKKTTHLANGSHSPFKGFGFEAIATYTLLYFLITRGDLAS